ncbi:MAG TPA: TetR/AcrR family transcriptional regulator [Novosphingobium sp.]|nr:TetR/AcrR family transcriptional regulator [Novosphingobium sp.]
MRVAAERRDRMRARLLETVFELYQPGRDSAALVIDDVIRAAGVSRGTFYKYFTSIEQAVDALGESLAGGMVADFRALFAAEPDPAVLAIGGSAMTMLRAWHDPRWGGFTCRVDYVDYFARASALDTLVRDALCAARDSGQMRFGSLDVAVDLIVGMTVEARRRLIRAPEAPRAYIDEMLACTFAGLGMNPAVFALARNAAFARISEGVDGLCWWSTDIAA